ncbi:hypothetical protein N0V83_009719 [Neocucurbitaria cava]|uniref:Heterokaryon incompatibility domain-containing protein n=1 Tax=Neocucurbitaria cava TaxID=798079 RepID=A0A9W8Y1D2_9PLEO|nr:hypothetical protein N0V83_009719 [Neocucurbitaria cava]
MRDINLLCAAWNDAWESLTTQGDTTGVAESSSSASHRLEMFQRRVWALVDAPLTNRHSEDIEHSRKHILDIIKRVPPSHTPLSHGEFRLLRLEPGAGDEPIKCSLTNVSVEAIAGNYNAISYCWGPPTQPQKIIFLDGRPIVVSDTLLDLLSHFNRLTPEVYWLDALCIRQDDLEEKNTQIPLMRRIYSDARLVDIWLGPDKEDSGYVLEQIYRGFENWKSDSRCLIGLRNLLLRPWFQRLWVVQELVLARPEAPVLRSGFASCKWGSFAAFMKVREAPKHPDIEPEDVKRARVSLATDLLCD